MLLLQLCVMCRRFWLQEKGAHVRCVQMETFALMYCVVYALDLAHRRTQRGEGDLKTRTTQSK